MKGLRSRQLGKRGDEIVGSRQLDVYVQDFLGAGNRMENTDEFRIELEIDIHGGRPPTEQHRRTSPNEVDPAFAPRLCTETPHEFLHLGSIRRFPHGIGVPR